MSDEIKTFDEDQQISLETRARLHHFFSKCEYKDDKDVSEETEFDCIIREFMMLVILPSVHKDEVYFEENDDKTVFVTKEFRKDHVNYLLELKNKNKEVLISVNPDFSIRLITVDDIIDKDLMKTGNQCLNVRWCEFCEKPISKNQWDKHLDTQTHKNKVDGVNFVAKSCNVCDDKKIFDNYQSWEKHLKTITHKNKVNPSEAVVPEKFFCKECNKEFLRRNEKTHVKSNGHLDKVKKAKKLEIKITVSHKEEHKEENKED